MVDFFVLSRSHEDMSLKMIDYIVDKHCIDIDSAILKTAKVRLSFHQLYL